MNDIMDRFHSPLLAAACLSWYRINYPSGLFFMTKIDGACAKEWAIVRERLK